MWKTIFNIVDFEIKYGVKLNRIILIILQRRVIYTNNLSFLTQTIISILKDDCKINIA